jgi:predicted amidophosphoribosyltransferase
MKEPRYPICPDCQENLTTLDSLHVCPGCGLEFSFEAKTTQHASKAVPHQS